MIDYTNMNPMQIDALREIGSIGSGNAATALSQLLSSKIVMKVPKFDILDFTELQDIFGGAENVVVGVLQILGGNINGCMMCLLSQESGHYLVGKMMGVQKESTSAFSKIELSVIEEIGNIISGAYLSSISQMTGLEIKVSVPSLVIDMAGAVLSVPAIEFGMSGDKAVLLGSQISDEHRDLDGHFILIPSLESYEVIMKALGILGE